MTVKHPTPYVLYDMTKRTSKDNTVTQVIIQKLPPLIHVEMRPPNHTNIN